MPTINMRSAADKIKGQGVGSAYNEQVNLVKNGLIGKYRVYTNSIKKCDIVHFHTINFSYYLSLYIKTKKSASVGYVHFLPETIDDSISMPKICKNIFYKYIIHFYKNMDYLVTVNPSFIKKLSQYGINEDKITYIPNFVSDNMFYYSDSNNTRDYFNIDKDKFVVLGVGQVQMRKGILDFVEIAKKMPDIIFVWAGGFSFGPATCGYKKLKELMLNPPDNVKFLGIVNRKHMNDIYNMCDLLFLPSYSELFPMTILEAMCCKKPILLRDLDIYPDILFNYYLKANTHDDFINTINKLKNSTSFYKKWANNSWKGHEFYSEENVLRLWEMFYDKVILEKQVKNRELGFEH